MADETRPTTVNAAPAAERDPESGDGDREGEEDIFGEIMGEMNGFCWPSEDSRESLGKERAAMEPLLDPEEERELLSILDKNPNTEETVSAPLAMRAQKVSRKKEQQAASNVRHQQERALAVPRKKFNRPQASPQPQPLISSAPLTTSINGIPARKATVLRSNRKQPSPAFQQNSASIVEAGPRFQHGRPSAQPEPNICIQIRNPQRQVAPPVSMQPYRDFQPRQRPRYFQPTDHNFIPLQDAELESIRFVARQPYPPKLNHVSRQTYPSSAHLQSQRIVMPQDVDLEEGEADEDEEESFPVHDRIPHASHVRQVLSPYHQSYPATTSARPPLVELDTAAMEQQRPSSRDLWEPMLPSRASISPYPEELPVRVPRNVSRMRRNDTEVSMLYVPKEENGDRDRYFLVKTAAIENLSISQTHEVWLARNETATALDNAFVHARTGGIFLFVTVPTADAFFYGYCQVKSRATTEVPSAWRRQWKRSGPIGFHIKWLETTSLSFRKVEDIPNPYDNFRCVKDGRDGQEIPTEVGDHLLHLYSEMKKEWEMEKRAIELRLEDDEEDDFYEKSKYERIKRSKLATAIMWTKKRYEMPTAAELHQEQRQEYGWEGTPVVSMDRDARLQQRSVVQRNPFAGAMMASSALGNWGGNQGPNSRFTESPSITDGYWQNEDTPMDTSSNY